MRRPTATWRAALTRRRAEKTSTMSATRCQSGAFWQTLARERLRLTAGGRDYAAMPHLDRFALSELASESEPLGDASEEQGARLSAERAMMQRDRAEARAGGRGVRRPVALGTDDDGA